MAKELAGFLPIKKENRPIADIRRGPVDGLGGMKNTLPFLAA